jgi:ADP-heptose:LPS heptosyltransferase
LNRLKLGELLFNHFDAQIILFGSERDIALADQFQQSVTYPFINLICQTTLRELGSYLKAIDVLVSNDTGPIHVAAAVSTKVVGIFMGTAYFELPPPMARVMLLSSRIIPVRRA